MEILGERLSQRVVRLTLWVAAAAALVAIAAAQTLFAYSTNFVAALLAPAALAVVVAVALRPMVGVYLGILAIPLERLDLRFGGEIGLSPAEGMLLLAAGIAATRFFAEGGLRHLHPTQTAFGCLLLVMATGLTFAGETLIVMKIGMMWSAFLILTFVVARAGREQLRRMLICLSISGGILGVVAMMASGDQSLVAGGRAVTNRAEAGFAHPAVLAFFLVLTIAPALALAIQSRPRVGVAMLICGGLATAGLLLSLTRGAIIGAVVSLIVMLAWPRFRRLAFGLLAITVVFAAFNLKALEQSKQLEVIGTRLSTVTETRATSENQRVRIWAAVPGMVAERPLLGTGAGNFGPVSQARGLIGPDGTGFYHAHNVLLTIVAELGLVGLAFFLWFLFEIARTAGGLLRDRFSADYPMAIALTAALIGLFANSMTDYPPGTNVIAAVMMLHIGALLALERLRNTEESAPPHDEPAVAERPSPGDARSRAEGAPS